MTYEDGLIDAWNIARKLFGHFKDSYSYCELLEVFDINDDDIDDLLNTILSYEIIDVIKKIEQYEGEEVDSDLRQLIRRHGIKNVRKAISKMEEL